MLKHCLYLLASGYMSVVAYAQSSIPEVPSKMKLADMTLTITAGGKEDIQRDVNMLRASDRYFKVKLDRVALYMPIIERIFKEEGVPDDLKYLVLQESALISDAVSSSNAVGFWQFKEFTADEVGMRVDDKIDERKNIVSSTRGAARYFLSHQKQLDNWALTVTAHMTGAGGIKKYVKNGDHGAKKMTIDKKTHWYLKRFLAHKIAFQDHLDHPHSQGLALMEYSKGGGRDLNRISKDFDVPVADLKEYNKWLLQEEIPTDRKYTLVIPASHNFEPSKELVAEESATDDPKPAEESKATGLLAGLQIKSLFATPTAPIKVNGVPAIVAKEGDTFDDLISKSGLPKSKFLKFNDLEKERIVLPGDIYFVKKKKGKSSIGFHVVQHGEGFWELSQQYGIRMDKLASHNRMSLLDDLKPGRVLWMAKRRPNNVDVEYREVPDPKPSQPAVATTTEAPLEKERTSTTELRPQAENREESLKDTPVAVAPVVAAPVLSTPTSQRSETGYHTVQAGETLWGISQLYGLDVGTLRELNQLKSGDALQAGQQLAVKEEAAENVEPSSSVGVDRNAVAASPSATTHVVKTGETLWQIGQKYNMDVGTLRALNGLGKDDPIKLGQELVISTDPPAESNQVAKSTATYVVKTGDTLYGIARSHNMELDELLNLNKKADNSLSVGEELLVYE